MSPSPHLMGLPREIRDQIWEILGYREDFTNLLHTSARIRSDILDRIPGGHLLCNCQRKRKQRRHAPHWKPECRRQTELDKLCVISDSECLSGSWLRLEATWFIEEPAGSREYRRKESTWSVKDQHSVFAKVLKYYRARETIVVFEAPQRGYYLAALLIIMAKMCDAINLVNLLDPRWGSFRIHFKDEISATNTRPNTPFWEVRADMDKPLFLHRKTIRQNCCSGEQFPRFYECLMVPVLYCTSKGPCGTGITFDHPPKKKNTLFRYSDRRGARYADYTELSSVAVLAYWGRRCNLQDDLKASGRWNAADPDPRDMSDEAIESRWGPDTDWEYRIAERMRTKNNFDYVMIFLKSFYEFTSLWLQILGYCEKECGLLHDYGHPAIRKLRRHVLASLSPNEGLLKLPGHSKTWFEGSVHLMKRRYAQWAMSPSSCEGWCEDCMETREMQRRITSAGYSI